MKERERLTKEQRKARLGFLHVKGGISKFLAFCAAVAMIVALGLTGSYILAVVFLFIAVVFGALASQAAESRGEIRKDLWKGTTTEQRQAKLRFLNNKKMVTRILALCAVAAIVLSLVITENLLIALGFLVLAILLGNQSGRAAKSAGDLKTILGEDALSNAIRDVLGYDVEYNPEGRLKPGSMVFPFVFDRSLGKHHFRTVFDGVRMELGSVILVGVFESSHEDSAVPVFSTADRFRGPWLICEFGRKPSCDVFISQWTTQSLKNMESNVPLENQQFASRFCVQAEDPQEAHKILTPRMMEAISAAADRSGGTFYLSFLLNGKTNIAIHTGHDLFELGNGYEDGEELRRRFAEELRRLTDIAGILNVKE